MYYVYVFTWCTIGGKMVGFRIILILRNSSINFHSNSNRDRKTRQPSIFALPPISILFYSRYKTIKCVILIFQCHFYIVCSTENDILIKLAPSFEPDHLLQKQLSSNILVRRNQKCVASCKITIKCKILLLITICLILCPDLYASYHKKHLYDHVRSYSYEKIVYMYYSTPDQQKN